MELNYMNKFKCLVLFIVFFLGITFFIPKSLVNSSSPFINVIQSMINTSDYLFKSNNSEILKNKLDLNKYGVIKINGDLSDITIYDDVDNNLFDYTDSTIIKYIETKKYFYFKISMTLSDNNVRNILAKNINQSYLNHNYKEIDLRKNFFYITSKQKNMSFKDFAKNTLNIIGNNTTEKKYKELIDLLIFGQNVPFDKHSVVIKLDNNKIEFYLLPTTFLSEFSII
jgi:hypothetical protein